jgi:hypothetical protein
MYSRLLLEKPRPNSAKICQLIFETVHATPDMGYTGRFSVQEPER